MPRKTFNVVSVQSMLDNFFNFSSLSVTLPEILPLGIVAFSFQNCIFRHHTSSFSQLLASQCEFVYEISFHSTEQIQAPTGETNQVSIFVGKGQGRKCLVLLSFSHLLSVQCASFQGTRDKNGEEMNGSPARQQEQHEQMCKGRKLSPWVVVPGYI